MSGLNLLPWRQARRRELQQQFLTVLVGAMIIVAGLIYLANSAVAEYVDQQRERNELITQEIAALDVQIEEIRQLKQLRQRLIDRTRVVEQLQQQRSDIVHLFDQLVETLPPGVYLTNIKQDGEQIELKGVAQSNARVSAYMKQLDDSDWLADPRLSVIETRAGEPSRYSEFVLRVRQTRPQPDDDGETPA